MTAPTEADIQAAEHRVIEAKRNARIGLLRLRLATRAALARPATLAAVAGGSALIGFLLMRRPRAGGTGAAAPLGAAVAAVSIAGLIRSFAFRYGMRYLPLVLEQVRAARRRRDALRSP